MPDEGLRPTRSDVVNAYRLALGRNPESLEVVDEAVRHGDDRWLSHFFGSSEFHVNVLDPLRRSADLSGEFFQSPPPAGLINWAASTFPLSDDGRAAMRRTNDWYALFHTLLADDVFGSTVLAPHADNAEAYLEARTAIERRQHGSIKSIIHGGVDLVSNWEVRGWAVDVSDLERALAIELYVEGIFQAAATTNIFRRDLQERFGGHGRFGFSLHYDQAIARTRAQYGELRDSASGKVIADVVLPVAKALPADAIATVRNQLDDLRRMLARIEAHLPSFQRELGFSLESYDDYYRAYYAPTEQPEPGAGGHTDLSIVVDASGVSPICLGQMLASVGRQHHVPREVIVVYDEGDTKLEADEIIDRFRVAFGGILLVSAMASADGWAAKMSSAAADSIAANLLFIPPGGEISPHAAGGVMRALGEGAQLVFADEDAIEPLFEGATRRHKCPIFRTAFDNDLLLQFDCVGQLIGGARSTFLDMGFRAEHERARFYDVMLRAADTLDHGRIVHLPRILLHSTAAATPPLQDRMAALEDHVRRRGLNAQVEQHVDQLGAPLPGTTRLRRFLNGPTKIAIIIPTRDRLDLLGPCLASVVATIKRNFTEIEIIIVNNKSDEAATHTFLQTFSSLVDLRVLDHNGTFNWALINNRAAALTQADVLVFLNNDTIVLSEDCWDELAVNALRPDIGAVGARLLYEDGTIQHAGVVLGEWDNFATHEGVGEAGVSPGYMGRHALVRQVSTITGACLATRADLFRSIGGFDDVAFPIEGNETDYCFRLRAKGYKILYDPAATLYHLESKSRGFNVDVEERHRAIETTRRLRARWGGQFRQDPFYNPHFDRSSIPFSRLQAPRPLRFAPDANPDRPRSE